jgi:hypothetical protein
MACESCLGSKQEIGLKAAVTKPPPNLKALEIWNSPAMLQLRASQQEIETQQEQTLRQQELDQVLGRIAHETGVPRRAVRSSITQVASRLGTDIAAGFMSRFARRPEPPREPPPQAPEEAPMMLSGPPTQPEPLQLPAGPPPSSVLVPDRRQLARNIEMWPEMRRHDFGFGRDYAYQQEQAQSP